jgi:hypothetical protein
MFIRIALGAVAALLVCAGTAQASSLVYIKDYNVWTANPDGTGARPITTDGFKELPYGSPSQSDDGTILAARGEKFVKLDRQGNRIGNPLPSILVGRPPWALAVGPFDPQISPDGHKLAYWIGTWSTWFDYGSSINWTEPHDAVIWQDADTGAQLGFTLNYQKPSWFQDSQHALLNQPMNRFAAQIVAGALGANEHDSTPILKDSDSKPAGEYYSQDLADPELTKAGDKLVTLRGPDQETIRFYDMRSGPPVISESASASPSVGRRPTRPGRPTAAPWLGPRATASG